MSNPFATVPPAKYQAAAADLIWGIDTSAWVDAVLPNGTAVVESVTLTGPTGATIALVDEPQLVGNVVYQRVRAGVLSPNPRPYQLVAQVGVATTTNQQPFVLALLCPL